MIAIWPAGPPKLMNPSFSQKREASVKLTRSAGSPSGTTTDAGGTTAECMSALGQFVVDRGTAAAREEHIEPLPIDIEGSGMGALLGPDPFGQSHRAAVDDVNQT